MANHYETLGVGRTASSADIKKAYVRLARERHPDRFSDPEQRRQADDFFKDLTAAFNTLNDSEARRQYDATLDNPQATAPQQMAQDAFARGSQALKAKDFGAAAELLRAAAHLAPEEHRYHSALATALAQNPKWAREAMQAVERAVQLAPRHAPYLVQLARLQSDQGLKLRARKTAEQARDIAPDDADVRRLCAELVPEGQPGDAGKAGEPGGLGGFFKRKG